MREGSTGYIWAQINNNLNQTLRLDNSYEVELLHPPGWTGLLTLRIYNYTAINFGHQPLLFVYAPSWQIDGLIDKTKGSINYTFAKLNNVNFYLWIINCEITSTNPVT